MTADPSSPRSAAPAAPRNPTRGTRYSQQRPAVESRADSFAITGKAIVLVFIAVLIAFAFYGVRYLKSREEVNASISYVSHTVINDSTLRVWADITRNRPNETAYCIVQAFDYDKNEVGRREIAVAADNQEAIRVSVDIPTNARAVAGGVYGCSSAVPNYLDTEHPQYTVE